MLAFPQDLERLSKQPSTIACEHGKANCMTNVKPHPSEALTFDPDDINGELEQRHREVMLNLVLTWGSLDGALGMMLSRSLGVALPDGAELVGRLSSSMKFEELRKQLLQSPNGQDAAKLIRRHKKKYEHHSKVRNQITHSHCAGFWTVDPEYVVFLKFERVGDQDLAVDRVPLDAMVEATNWGRMMKEFALHIANAPYGVSAAP